MVRSKKINNLSTKSSSLKTKIDKLMKTQKGEPFTYVFRCALCSNKHHEGYEFVDSKGKVYEVCNYCCKRKNQYVRILYTPIGNKR